MALYDVSGKWSIIHKDNFVVDVSISQNGEVFSGSASHSSGSVQSLALEGSLVGEIFTCVIEWDDNTIGHYAGYFTGLIVIDKITGEVNVNPKRIVGITFDTSLLEKQTTWVSNNTFPPK